MKNRDSIRQKIIELTEALPEYNGPASEALISTKRVELLGAVAALRWVIEEQPAKGEVYRIVSGLEV